MYYIFLIMSNNTLIKNQKWDKKDRTKFFNSCRNILNIKEPQFYQPIFSLYFNIHNTKSSTKAIALDNIFKVFLFTSN